MQRADQHTQQQIADLVDACAGYWELRGIARVRSNEMQLELGQHLQQAVSDGKSLEAVLGPNPLRPLLGLASIVLLSVTLFLRLRVVRYGCRLPPQKMVADEER